MVMRVRPLFPLNKFSPLKWYFLVAIILLEDDIFNWNEKMHFYFTYDLNPMIFQSYYLGDGDFFKGHIKGPQDHWNWLNSQNVFIRYCFYCWHFFSLENVQGGLISFLHLVNFILCCISQRSRISFPLTHPYFSSFFPLSLFNQTLPPKRNCSNWNF